MTWPGGQDCWEAGQLTFQGVSPHQFTFTPVLQSLLFVDTSAGLKLAKFLETLPGHSLSPSKFPFVALVQLSL